MVDFVDICYKYKERVPFEQHIFGANKAALEISRTKNSQIIFDFY